MRKGLHQGQVLPGHGWRVPRSAPQPRPPSGQLGGLVGTHQVHGLARHLAHDEAHLGHQDHCQWLVSVPPPTDCEDEETELLQDPLPVGLLAFVTEMGVTTEPRDEAQRVVGLHMHVWCVRARVCAGAQALGTGWMSALGVPGGASQRGLTGWAPCSLRGRPPFRPQALWVQKLCASCSGLDAAGLGCSKGESAPWAMA